MRNHFYGANMFIFLIYDLISRYVDVSTGPGQHFVFAVERYSEMPRNNLGFSLLQRKWASISVNQVSSMMYMGQILKNITLYFSGY